MTEVSSSIQASNDTPPVPIHPAFERIRSEQIPSLRIVIDEYHHRKTGAIHYHLASENDENVFLVAFRTVPMDSTGVAHILEHTALCGSERFPVRDPFFMMIRRSLNTFMNAFTSSDWTAYPFASKNRKDFNNLLNVYLDAAFFSRLDELDFFQEGHRLEFAEPDNPDSDLEFKGVVYNEMKGAMSSTNSILWHTLTKYLFPTTTYHYNSGGEPEHIPDLSYQNLLEFYKSHYHPSNAVFMTFGNIPAHEHHQQFEELALSRFEQLNNKIEVNDEKRYFAPVKVEESYSVDEVGPNKTHVVVGWLLGRSTDLSELFEAQLLSSVLLDNSASPLLNVLETSSLGTSPSPMCGLEDSNREMAFMAGLEGCTSNSTQEVEELVLNTLKRICESGVPQDQVEAALHQLELHQREISGDSYPYGLQLILMGLSSAIHGGDPIKVLDIDPVLAELRRKIQDPDYIPGLIKQRLLDNPHRVTLTLQPDEELSERQRDAERSKLDQIKSTLSGKQKQQLVNQAQSLLARQSQEDNPDVLPKVGLEDVPRTMDEPQRFDSKLDKSESPVSYYAQGTNGLCYQQLVLQLPAMEDALLRILPLYSSCISELGVADKDYAEVQTWQARVSGGINCFSSIRSHRDDEQQTHTLLTFSSKSLGNNHQALTELLRETFYHARFDETERVIDLIDQLCARKEASITGNGHSLAMNLASSRMSPAALMAHEAGGLEGIRRLKSLRDSLKQEAEASKLLESFAALHKLLLSAKRQFLLITEEEFKNHALKHLNSYWDDESYDDVASGLELAGTRASTCAAWTTATQVNFCAKAYSTVPSQHPDNATLHVLAGFLRNGYLHRAIREQGGAYGGGAGQDVNSASFRFFSYRDPRLQATLDDFDGAIRWLLDKKHSDHQLEEAILGVIATMDKPSSPAGEARQAFYNHLFGRTLDQRMEFRQRVLATTEADLKQVAERYLLGQQASIGILTNRENAKSLEIDGLEIVNL